MKKIKILSIIGTRPEAIKMAPVINALAASPHIDSLVCSTGQHRQMLDSVLSLFRIKPDFDLGIMKPGQDLTDITSAVLVELRDVLRQNRPDMLLAQGDTTTTMSASIAAHYEKIPVGHVEAGLRTGDIYSPWPEEMNRKITGVLATLHFPPTQTAEKNLLREGVDPAFVIVTGNTVIDALLEVIDGVREDAPFVDQMSKAFPFLDDSCKRIILVTGHRRESFGQGFESMCEAMRQLALRGDVRIVYPVHLNPNVREPVNRILGGLDSVELLEPLDYRQFVFLMDRSFLILTDSGGVQEEAPSLGKPVLVMREVTERAEGIEAGTVKLIGTDKDCIVKEAELLLDDEKYYLSMSHACNPYGDGKAALRIVEAILSYHDLA